MISTDHPAGTASALAAAEWLLAGTADAITSDTPAHDLLACLTRYRAHLSALAAATRGTAPGALWPGQATGSRPVCEHVGGVSSLLRARPERA
jgi:hypothetical protein